MLTKTQLKIMEVFVANINERFSIKNISDVIKKPYPLVHRSIKSLINDNFLIRDKQNFLSLNYKENHLDLAYVESLRKKDFIKKNKIIELFIKDVLKTVKLDFFVFLIFGSSVKNVKKPRDIDILFVIEDKNKVNDIENTLYNITSNFYLKFDINVIAIKSIYEMLSKREELNVINETLNNHMLIFGAENYYRLLKNAR